MSQFASQQPDASPGSAWSASPAGQEFHKNNPGWFDQWGGMTPRAPTPSTPVYHNPDAIMLSGSDAAMQAAAQIAAAREQASAQRYAAEQQANASKQGSYQQGLGSIGNNFSNNYNTLQGGINNQTTALSNNFGAFGNIIGAGIGATGNLGRDIASNYNTYQSAANAGTQAQQQNAAERQRAISAGYGQNAQSNALNLRAYTEAGNAVTDANARLQVGQLGALSGLANSNSAAYVGNAQGNAGIANAYANAASANQAALANVANAQANAAGSARNAAATEAAARSVAAGNMTSAALGAYGGMGNFALSAVSQNAAAYQSALAALGAANQGALAANSVGLANAYAGQGSANQAALAAQGATGAKLSLGRQVLGSLAGGSMGGGGGSMGGGGSFAANGPGGLIASGSYGGSGIPAQGGLGQMFGALPASSGGSSPAALQAANTDAMNRIGNASAASDLRSGYSSGAGDMRAAFTSGQALPQTMLSSAFPNFQSLLSQGLGAMGSGGGGGDGGGANFGDVMNDLKSGYQAANTNIGKPYGSLNSNYDKYLSSSSGMGSQILSDKAFTPQVLSPLITAAYEANRGQNNSAYAAQDAASQGVYTGAQSLLSSLLSQNRSAMDSANAGINGLLTNIGSLVGQGRTGMDDTNALIVGTGRPGEDTQYTRSLGGYNNANQNARDVMTNMGNAYYSQPVLTSGRQEFTYNNYPRTPAPVAPRSDGRGIL